MSYYQKKRANCPGTTTQCHKQKCKGKGGAFSQHTLMKPDTLGNLTIQIRIRYRHALTN
uniref:Uncharacterized protein n=1 Tax=Proteus vulgaris TaxID=585 RepID=Q8KJW6_PROVU|nr:hypothetical protein [Proteus vulgaris]